MNQVIILGNLVRDPEVRYTPDTQTAVCTMTVALSRGKDKDGNDRGADFPQVTVWGKQAENCERFLSKGSKVAVSGRISTGSYKDKDGKTIYTTGITADKVEFLSSRQKSDNSPSGFEPDPSVPEGFSSIDDDDIPF